MGTLHVCFADLPQYGSATTAPSKSDNNTIEGNAVSTAAMTLQPTQQQQQNQCNNKDAPGRRGSSSVSPTPRYERNMSFFQQLSRRFGLRSHDDPVNSAAEDDSTDSCSSTTGTMQSLTADANGVTVTITATNNAAMSSSPYNNSGNGNGFRAKDDHGSSTEQISMSCASSETSSTIDIEEQQQQQQRLSQADTPNKAVNGSSSSNNSTLLKERRSSARASFSRLHRRSTTSIRRAFESFSLSSRSLSCSGVTPPLQQQGITNGDASSSGSGSTPIKSALKCSSNMELHKKSHSNNAAATTSANKSAGGGTKTKSKPPPQRILRQPVSYTYLKGMSGLPTQRVPRSAVCCQYARR